MISFWRWFLYGSGSGPGIRRYFDWWLFLHLGVASLAAVYLPITLETASVSLLLPLAGVLIGLSFAWGGNAQALLQTVEVEDLAKHRRGGYEEYIYTFQAAILFILFTLVAWGAAGLGIFDHVWPKNSKLVEYKVVVGFLFFLSSISLRECWQIILGAQALLLVRYKMKQRSGKSD